MFGGKRWCFTTCALFILCPRNFLLAASSHRRSYSNKVPVSKTLSAHSKTARWSMNIINDKGNALRQDEPEPGFDFNDEEIKKLKIWPGGDIPYYIDEFSFDKVFRDRLRNFLDMTNSATGLNFLELPRPPGDDETRWVLFVNRQGLLNCVDHPFKNYTSQGVQKVVLGYDCLSNGGGLAEVVLSLVGVPPQHNAPDRNKYIEIIKDNIMPGKGHLFEILKDNEWLFHEVDYDYASAGHYNLHKYTKNGKATIKPVSALQVTVGEGKGFSYTDIWKIRIMYNYISKKRLKSLSVPECQKLFNIGPKFSKYVHETQDNIEPRKKPNKYLGLPDESISTNNGEINNETGTQEANTDGEVSTEENVSKKEKYVGNLDDKAKESKEKMNHENDSESNENAANSAKKENKDVTNESLQAQSDSKSDGDAKPQELKFTNPGYRGYK